MRRVTLSWHMEEDGVIAVSATDAEGRRFPVLDVFRRPLIERGEMEQGEAKAFQVFAAERICAAWNADHSAADIARNHKIDPNMDLSEWGQGHNAACDQIAFAIARRIDF